MHGSTRVLPPARRVSVALLVLGAALLLALLGLPALVRLAADWYWFEALHFEAVFLTSLGAKIGLGVGAGLFALAFFYLNLRLAQRGIVPDAVILSLSPSVPRLDLSRVLRPLTWPIALVLALPVGLSASGAWLTLLRFLHRTPFGDADPVFGRDVGWYVFTLPLVTAVLRFVVALTVIALILTLTLYFLRRDVVVLGRRVTIERSAETHLAALIATLFAAMAADVFLVRIPSLLFSTGDLLSGATYADLAVRLPVLRLAALIALGGAALVVVGARTRRLPRNALAALALYLIVAGPVASLAPAAAQRLLVLPNELAREAPQLERHIAATRRAWGLDAVVTRDLSGEARLTRPTHQANPGTIKNVRLWDREPLLQTFGQLQEIRTYYDFISVDDDRYWIDGEYRQVLLSARELNSASLPTRTFINQRLTFTHGMGLTLGPVNQVTQEGLPVLFIKDLPPASTVSLSVSRPAIYYGELSDDYVFVRTGQKEFDYPSGDENVFAAYEGTGGVPVASALRRLIFSARFGSLKILLSKDIRNESRALYHRNIRERAQKALPFLRWDRDPYLVISGEGQLKWILDAYTSTDRYPYAQPLADGTNYMRNSVKVVIDAYEGTVEAYIAESGDPLIRTYDKIFPGIFRPLDAMPPDLRSHVRYPEDLFGVQTALYTRYHMREAQTFYQREDQWQIPVVERGQGARDPFLRHIIMKLPGEAQEEFILMTPFTPRQKDNLAAWMVARNDGEHYGQLVVYRFPRQSLVFGPTQVVNRINQDTEISRQVSLWDQRGSEVIRGNLLVIPIEESLIFVQALYLRAEGGQIPELKRVIVAYQNQVVMEETLAEGLARLFGGTVETGSRPTTAEAAATRAVGAPGADLAGMAREAAGHYEQAIAAQRAGDWARYGEEMRRVGELLRRLQQAAGASSRR